MLAPDVQVDSAPPIKYDFLFLYAVSDLQNLDEMLLNQPVGAGDQPLVLKHTMTTGQIFLDESEAFFSLMAEYTPEASAVVVCDRHHHLGGMMMSTMSAEALWGELIAEACWALRPKGPSLTVTPDGGRFTRQQLAPLERQIRQRLVTATGINKIHVGCEASEAVAGIQVADIIANSATHARHITGASADVAAQLLTERGVAIRDAEFPFTPKPSWFAKQQVRILGA